MESGGQSRSDREYLRVRNKMGPSYFWKSLLGSTVLKLFFAVALHTRWLTAGVKTCRGNKQFHLSCGAELRWQDFSSGTASSWLRDNCRTPHLSPLGKGWS